MFRRCLLLRVLLISVLAGILIASTSAARAQEPAPAWCKQEQLDLDLGPRGDSPNSTAQWLTVELRNRLDSPCKLLAGLSGDGPFYDDSSPAAAAFKQNDQRIPPRGLVHLLFAWTSAPIAVDGVVMDQCKMIDTLPITPFSGPWLEIRHLWARTCDGWWSAFRMGPYQAGEPISKDWLNRVHLRESDFTADDPPDPPGPSPLKLWTFSHVQYLQGEFASGYYSGFHLILETASGTFPDCPLRSVRKREVNGATTISLSPCDTHPAHELPDTFGSKPTKAMGFWTSDFGLSPERTGRVEYSVTANVLRDGKEAVEEARLAVTVRDPNRPMLPVIDTNAPNCQMSQLKLTSPVAELGTHWDRPTSYPVPPEDAYDGKVFELTNTSGESCMIGGMPELKFLPWHPRAGEGLAPYRCANCANPLFQPRDIHWIEIAPGASAHFLVVRFLSHLSYSYWCNSTGGIELSLPGDKQIAPLPFEAAFCGPLHISAWRAGKYDGDPLNSKHDRAENERAAKPSASNLPTTSKVVCVDHSKRVSELPPPGPQCAELDFAKYGKPVMAPARSGVSFGVSSAPPTPTTVHIWVDNQTDKPQSYYGCCRSSFLSAIDIYDSAGQRLLSKGEQLARKTCAEGKDYELITACSCSTSVRVPSHSMQVVDSGALEDGYVLPPGRYYIAPSPVGRRSCDSPKKVHPELAGAPPADSLLLVIPSE